MDPDTIWILVPLTALAIPLVAVVGRMVVKPIADAILKLGVAEQIAITNARSEQYFSELDARVARMEQRIDQLLVIAEKTQRRQLESGAETVQPPRLENDSRISVSRL